MNNTEFDSFLDAPALADLNRAEKAEIAGLLKTPAKSEFFFLLQLIGKSPTHVRDRVVDEFARRHPSVSNNGATIVFPWTISDWKNLHDAVSRLAESADGGAYKEFWARMRYVIAALPKHGPSSDASLLHQPAGRPRQEWSYATCKHCWRRVAHNSGLYRKTASYCYAHNLPSAHPIYRKHSRLARSVLVEQQAAMGKITAMVRDASTDADAQDIIIANLTSPSENLPHVATYLEEVGHDGTPEGLLWAFHGPSHAIKDAEYSAALERYIQYVLDAKIVTDPNTSCLIFSYDELSRAEAWLTLLGSGGRRR
ncbi:MAG: hypothetical protein LUC93_05000 [Planctomycetaceae bacterium]|nr:hypothetical protein [Planctomycetaceae bacterium]